jgi:hypothetical protein
MAAVLLASFKTITPPLACCKSGQSMDKIQPLGNPQKRLCISAMGISAPGGPARGGRLAFEERRSLEAPLGRERVLTGG